MSWCQNWRVYLHHALMKYHPHQPDARTPQVLHQISPQASPQVRDAPSKLVVEQDELESNVVNLIAANLIHDAVKESKFIDTGLERFHGRRGHVHDGC
jgi:hypothetical protein